MVGHQSPIARLTGMTYFSRPMGDSRLDRQHSRECDENAPPPAAVDSHDGDEGRVAQAWRHWLEALGRDAEAALATSLAYGELDDGGRERWLDVLAQDAAQLSVPRIAVYAPLLAVESDPARRDRIRREMGPEDVAATPRGPLRALRGHDSRGWCIAAITTPLYLDFVEVLACCYRPAYGVEWVRHDPILARDRIPQAGEQLEGVQLERVPMSVLIDELAHAIVAHTRSGRELPEALRTFAHLFSATAARRPECPV